MQSYDSTLFQLLVDRYRVRLRLLEPLLGTVPKSETVFTDYLASLALKRRDGGERITPEAALELIEEEKSTLPDREERGWTGFHEDEHGPFLYDYQVKGFIKEAASIVALMGITNIANLKNKVDNLVYVQPRRIRLTCLDEYPLERPLRAMTPRGPRVSLLRSDQVPAGEEINFELWVLRNKKEVTVELLRELLTLGLLKGLGQWRNGGYGRFQFELVEDGGGRRSEGKAPGR